MNDRVADILAEHFSGLEFIDLSAGCVQQAKIYSSSKVKRVPVARRVYPVTAEESCDGSKNNYEISPDDSLTGISFFEDIEVTVVRSNTGFSVATGKLKLVVWVNLKKINAEEYEISERIQRYFPENINPDGEFYGGAVGITKLLPKRPSPFDIYDFDEKRRPFLNYPYGYFSFQVEYTVRYATKCDTALNITAPTC